MAVIIFTNKYSIKCEEQPRLTMKGIPIDYVKSTCYLGVIIDHQLQWTEHINFQIAKCKRTLMTIKTLVHKNWGLSPKQIWWIWQSIVRPQMSYCSIVWAEPTILKKFEDKLNALQRLALSQMTFSQKSTPTKGIEVILGIQPLGLFLRETALKARLRTASIVESNWTGETNRDTRLGHIKSLDLELNRVTPLRFLCDSVTSTTKCNATNT
jgi:hypothetical protein